ncbi:MAG: type II toxin-antitoxin system VapC family toxin [Verrucomicrobiota bacterium]
MIIVDTNILAYLLLPSDRVAEAQTLLQTDAYWAAPLLWRSEFRNTTLAYLRAGRITLHQAEQAVLEASLYLLAGEHVVADNAVLHLAFRHKCSAYDCEYVALAEAMGTILVTEDKALLKAFPQRCRSITQVI